jgi:hypothetical protein
MYPFMYVKHDRARARRRARRRQGVLGPNVPERCAKRPCFSRTSICWGDMPNTAKVRARENRMSADTCSTLGGGHRFRARSCWLGWCKCWEGGEVRVRGGVSSGGSAVPRDADACSRRAHVRSFRFGADAGKGQPDDVPASRAQRPRWPWSSPS